MDDSWGGPPEQDCDLFVEVHGQRFDIDWLDGRGMMPDVCRRRAAAIIHENAPGSGFDAMRASFEFE